MLLKRGRIATVAFIVLSLTAFAIPLTFLVPKVSATVLYDSGDPTPAEQLVLEYINRARASPVAEGQRLGIDIHEGLDNPSFVGPRPPLAMNKLLLSIAQAHSQDMYTLNYFSHNDPNGTTPFDRMTQAGYNYVRAGENMAAGVDLSAAELEDFMMVDSGTQGRPHRVNLLDLINSYPCGNPPCVYSEVGIGYYNAATPSADGLSSLITEDFGTTPNTGPFLLGVVYDDRNGNNFYDIGEGIGGVTITTSNGDYYAITSSSGGYAIPIGTSGTISVTASGPGFGPITKTVTLTGTNIKLDFTSQTTTTDTASQSSNQTPLTSVTFQSTPPDFPASITPGTITACGNTFSDTQSNSNCGNGFTATANLPVPNAGWQFNQWMWAGGVTCSSNTANPTGCAATGTTGTLTAVYAAQVNVMTNPPSSALIGWDFCSKLSDGNGASFFSTSYGTSTVTACYVPLGYAFSSWNCSGGLTCSGSSNPTEITFNGPGTITLNLKTVTLTNSTSTTPTGTLSTNSNTPTTITASTSLSTTFTTSTSSSSTTSIAMTATTLATASAITSSTYSTPEFTPETTMIDAILIVAVLLTLIKRKPSRTVTVSAH